MIFIKAQTPEERKKTIYTILKNSFESQADQNQGCNRDRGNLFQIKMVFNA
jgi:hypothetical protein